MRVFLAALASFLACFSAVAQPVAEGRRQAGDLIACGPSTDSFAAPEGHIHARRPWMAPQELVAYLTEAAPRLSIKAGQQTAKAVPTAQFRLARPTTVSPEDWSRAWLEAVLYPAGTSRTAIPAESLVVGIVQPHTPSETETEVIVEFPSASTGWLPSRWEVVLLICVDVGAGTNPNLENNRMVREFGRVTLYFSSLKLSAAIGIGTFALLYVVLAFTAARLHRRQYEVARAAAEREARRSIPAWQFALRPTVITQDAFGYCSLARFQVLMFTLVLAGVYAYVMARTGGLPTLSNTVLALLGITMTGSTLARVIEGPVVDTPNRVWLLGTGVIDPSPRIPRWQDMLAGEGEIDVTRVQALAFSIFAALALVVNGTGDLEHFEIPEQLNYLIGLSQAVYVAGRALPRESANRLNEEVRAAREAELQVIAKPGDQAAELAFETARNALGTSLFDFFGERFQAQRLMQLRPGDRPTPEIY
ncbi:hypothetical protein [Neoroseomonas soli]|uniref:Uncharacterized protein n=1 Tax=Neoroseomonas soli TaxID=1081025 RepID=A0A9X9WXF1_9PROT|nr:hypothetical protein [Neoroseomonas soli]MBR0671830.1 hypothetical protein [Neoroseomonas soli]